jgi:hypothetical protein
MINQEKPHLGQKGTEYSRRSPNPKAMEWCCRWQLQAEKQRKAGIETKGHSYSSPHGYKECPPRRKIPQN